MSAFETNSRELKEQTANLFRAIPDTMRGYQAALKAAEAEGVLPAKIKELMSLAIGITSHCEDCITFHIQNAIRHGATREEVAETIGVAVVMGGGPAAVYGGKALASFDQAAPAK
jgi:AhpD family alkylhydroperoxidase